MIKALLSLPSETVVYISFVRSPLNTPLTVMSVQQLIFLLSQEDSSADISVVYMRTAPNEPTERFYTH